MTEEEMIKHGFGPMIALKKQGRCPTCTKKVYQSELRNELERNEFKISGLCHRCQQEFFTPEGELRHAPK